MSQTPAPKAARQLAATAEFRRKSHRYDFYSTPAARTAIERLRSHNPTLSCSDVINHLALEGFKALFQGIAI